MGHACVAARSPAPRSSAVIRWHRTRATPGPRRQGRAPQHTPQHTRAVLYNSSVHARAAHQRPLDRRWEVFPLLALAARGYSKTPCQQNVSIGDEGAAEEAGVGMRGQGGARSPLRHLVVPQPPRSGHVGPTRPEVGWLAVKKGSACRRSKYERDGISRFHADFRKRGCSPPI